jgi:hypothetical protein
MGKLMGVLKPQLAGQADMGQVSALVKARLAERRAHPLLAIRRHHRRRAADRQLSPEASLVTADAAVAHRRRPARTAVGAPGRRGLIGEVDGGGRLFFQLRHLPRQARPGTEDLFVRPASAAGSAST